jgi:tetratricopeptide (TPR) repeat protein
MKKTLLLILATVLITSLPFNTGRAQADDESDSIVTNKGPRFGSDSITCVTNISLYREFFKQWKQAGYSGEAINYIIKPWRWVFFNCPLGTQNTYIDGIKIFDYLIKNETDNTRKEKLIDTMMMIYDRRIEYFGKEGYVLGRKGVDLYKLQPEKYEAVYDILKKSVNLEVNKVEEPVLIYYFRAAEKMVKDNKQDKIILVDIYDQANEIIDYNLKKYKDSQKEHESWLNVKSTIELSFEPYATCEDLIGMYSKKFEQNPDDKDLLQKITKILDKKKCTDSELFFKATENLHKIEPTAKSAELMGKMYIKKEQWNTAATYLREAIDLFGEGEGEDKADAQFLLANVYYQTRSYSAARTACYEVLKTRPNDGKAYILIGDLYGATAGDCGDDEIAKKSGYWAAVDKYIKAKSVDSSVAGEANERIATYSRFFPSAEKIFFYNLKEGDAYEVGCWINETTTVRAAK